MNRIKWIALVVLVSATTLVQAQGYQPRPGNGGPGGAPAGPSGFPWDNPGMPGPGLHQPFDPLQRGGPLPGAQGPGLPGVPRFNPQVPIRPPQPQFPGIFPGEQKKDDDRNRGQVSVPPIHVVPPPLVLPPEVIARDAKGLGATHEAPRSSYSSGEFRAAGGGSGKWIIGLLGGLGAAVAGVFRSIFGLRSKESGSQSGGAF
jgi:hypothetical protein